VCVSLCLSGCTCPHFSTDLLQKCVHSLIFERILSKFAGNILRLTISGKDYVLFIFTHRSHACERACARARVIKHSLIYGRILFKFAMNILQVTSSSRGYVLLIFTHHVRACESVCASGRVVKTFTYLWILFKFAGHKLKMTTSYMGYIFIMFTYRGHARACD
jgi:hypothetical protein